MIDFIKTLACDAGKLAHEHFGSLRPEDINTKKTVKDLVSVADKAVEEKIISRIREKFPEHDIFGEETGSLGKSSDFCWVIDPIDGTQNFVKRIPHYSISIGLKHKGVPVAGCVYAPEMDMLFYAEQGKGAFENGKPIRISDCSTLESALCATGFACLRSNAEHNNLEYFNFISPQIRGIRRMGSAALDLCFVASGRVDAYWEMCLGEYDVAAGTIIAREAGAKVSSFTGEEIFPAADGILCTVPALQKTFIELLKQ